jgi:DNA-binding transcriptional LysR family regulator
MIMSAMRLEKLRQVDLNLLITFAAVAEEKSVTAAASRLLLSQPAVSRALQRARALFQDYLLVRSPNGFELTLRGRKVLDELEGLLPRMEHLIAPAAFDPAREKSHFRISGPDNVCTVVLPPLCRQYADGRYQVNFEFHPWQSGIAELVEIGRTGSAPLHMIAALATRFRLSNTWPQATSLSPLMPECRPFRTSNSQLLAQNATRVFECLTSAWPCSASRAQNSF